MQTQHKDHDGEGQWITVTLGFDLYFANKNKQEPHFTITGESRLGAGCIHDEIQEHFPKYKNVIRWHLCGLETGPMHYVANALYWLSRVGIEDKAWDHFRSTIKFGAIESDSDDFNSLSGSSEVKAWLESRLPALLVVMESDLNKAGIPTKAAKTATTKWKEMSTAQ